MNILILGSGGREHTLAVKIKESSHCEQLFIAPGNAGTATEGTNLNIAVDDFNAIKNAVIEHHIQLVIVGPELPLVQGIYDYFQADDILKKVLVIGPSKAAAQLEGSKAFAKEFMEEMNIPTAAYRSFTQETLSDAKTYLATQNTPIVLKADGLAAGKGVLILDDVEEAQDEIQKMLEGKFGAASSTVVIEEFLDGIEFSVFVITDGKDYQILPVAKDYKRIGEGDTGLNTGGMGAISPVSFVDDALMKKVEERIIQPTINGLQKRALDYKGFIFFGLINVQGDPYVIEYNCRLGDPETEVVLPRLKTDLVALALATHEGNLSKMQLEIKEDFATTVFLVSGGYPEKYAKGKVITGLNEVKDSLVFHAGTKLEGEKVLTNGGRVIAITSFGETQKQALEKSYKNAEIIDFEGKNYRKDIGFDL